MAQHQRHVDAAGAAAWSSGSAVRHRVLEGDPQQGTLCASGGGWDTHGNNFNCLRDHLLQEFDRPFAALLDDLHQRACSMKRWCWCPARWAASRASATRAPAGRPAPAATTGPRACRCCWPAAASAAARSTALATPRRIPADNVVGPEHIARTVFHAMGIDDLTATDREGRPFHLLDDGRPLTELF